MEDNPKVYYYCYCLYRRGGGWGEGEEEAKGRIRGRGNAFSSARYSIVYRGIKRWPRDPCGTTEGASHVCALKFKESAGDGAGYLLNAYAEYLMSPGDLRVPSHQSCGSPRYIYANPETRRRTTDALPRSANLKNTFGPYK